MDPEKFIAVLLTGWLCIGCATSEVPRPDQEGAAEVRAQMDVKAALLDDDQVAAAPIRVEHEGGRLRLSGFVESEAEKRRAGEVAKGAVPGMDVINDLRVWQPPETRK